MTPPTINSRTAGRVPRLVAAGVLWAGACGVSGCGTTEKPCPVSGQVFVNDRPAEVVYVVFHAVGGPDSRPGSARTAKDGSFSLRVRAPGEYAVTAFCPKVAVENGATVEGDDIFKGRYRNPDQPVQKIAIQDGDNAIPPIRLKSP